MSDTRFKVGDTVICVDGDETEQPGSSYPVTGGSYVIKRISEAIGQTWLDMTDSNVHGSRASRYVLAPKVVDPYKYDGLTLKCDETSEDTLTVSLDLEGIVVENHAQGEYAAIYLSPKKARKLAKALKALATTAESDLG